MGKFKYFCINIHDAIFQVTLILRNNNAMSSLLSGAAAIHECGGCRYRSQFLHQLAIICFGMPSVISTSFRTQFTHMLAGFVGMGIPHLQHRLRTASDGTMLKIQATYMRFCCCVCCSIGKCDPCPENSIISKDL